MGTETCAHRFMSHQPNTFIHKVITSQNNQHINGELLNFTRDALSVKHATRVHIKYNWNLNMKVFVMKPNNLW